ncbi:hypothetical protein DPV78_006463 [Talaromyces pinophilus]|nr:hypothetical protein DPV78_006463 [Talaromyces pinophilus]
MLFGSLPLEVILLVCDNLNIADLNALVRTCTSLARLLDSLLYQQAIKSSDYISQFIFAVIRGQSSAVSKFLKAGVSMSTFKECSFYPPYPVRNIRCDLDEVRYDAVAHKFHPFLAAAFFGYNDVLRILMSEGNVDVNFEGINPGPDTALEVAVWRNRPKTVKFLLEQGADIYCRSITTRSPIVHAVKCCTKTVLELIFKELHIRSKKLKLRGPKKEEYVKNIKAQCEEASLEACELGKPEAVEILLHHAVDVNLSIEDQRLLSYAAINHRVSTVQLLVKRGAKMENDRDCGIVTAMYDAHKRGEKEEHRILSGIVIYLLKSGCNVANGGIHACAVWCMANLKKSRELDRPFGTDRQREEIKRLLLKNGYDPKKCQHGCWKARSLERRYFNGTLMDLFWH